MTAIATFYDHMKEIAKQEGATVLEAMQEAKALGVELLEVSENNVIGREDELGSELAHTGMGISTIPAYFDFGRDDDVEKQCTPVLESARFLGAKKILVIPGFWNMEDGEAQKEEEFSRMIEGVNRLGELAPRYGVSLVMEEYDAEKAPFSTTAGVRRFLDNCPALSCAFDTGNFRFAAEDELEAYEQLKDRVTHVHLKDRSYRQANGEMGKRALDGKLIYPAPVGAGDLKIEPILSRLKQAGYEGVYTIEHYDSNRMLEYLKSSVKWVKEKLFS